MLFYYIFRTGQRSTMGLVKDGYNSCMRYVLNNFYDGFRQVRPLKDFSETIFSLYKIGRYRSFPW